ncbi:protein FAM189B isoform X2 [Electrophorus electricus]|uniref:protein FAM189B isoform X2 n=1 Tax=Electrophorus electricus TaxID=8005 RepID=UPI0015CF82C8|nr:protein FAM189B isoform X2 [Electrophorus electricus]
MPSPSDSSSMASMSGSRGFSGSRRGMSGRARARVLLYLGLCHLALGAMVLAFSFTSLAFTSSPRVRQSCPFWAGFFVVASGVVGVISWRRPFTLVVSLFMLLSAVCVILSLAGSMLSCQNAQMVKSYLTCQVENGLCLCCDPKQTCSLSEDETLVLYMHADCHSVRHQLKLAPHRTRSVNPECTTPQDAFLTNMVDFEEFVPPIPPPPYYPPEYTCSSETDAQSITYNGSMESPIPLYPTECPPPYEAVMGQRALSQATVFDAHTGEISAERWTSAAFSGEASVDSSSLLMSEIVDIPDDTSPSEDSCLMEAGVRVRSRAHAPSEEGAVTEDPRCPTLEPNVAMLPPLTYVCFRGERSNSCSSPSTYNSSTYRSPLMPRHTVLSSSCSQLQMLGSSTSQGSSAPEIPGCRCTSDTTRPRTPASLAAPVIHVGPCVHQRAGRDRRESDGPISLVRSHSEPVLSSSTNTGDFSGSVGSKGVCVGGCHTSSDAGRSLEACLQRQCLPLAPLGALPRKGSLKAGTERLPCKQAQCSSLRVPKDCTRSLGDLKVTRVLVQRLLQRSKRNLGPAAEHAGNCSQGPKRKVGGEGSLPLEQILRATWGASRGQQYQPHVHCHRRGHHHSHSESRHSSRPRDYDPVRSEGIHLRSCGDLSFTSAELLRRLRPPPHESAGALYSESAL